MSAADSAIVHLIRHGEPVSTGRLLGRTDIDVTAAGIAACVAHAVDLAPSAIVSSDLVRARRCADAIAAATAMSAVLDPRWRELNFGYWDGMAVAAVDQHALARFWDDPDEHPPPRGERWSALTARVGAALADCEDGTLIVTHAGAIRAALAVTCRLSVTQGWAFELPYAALVTLRLWRGVPPAAQIVRLRP